MSGNAPASRRAGRTSRRKAGMRGRVLIVEDDYLVCAQYEQVLTDAGCIVVGKARTAEEAVRLADETRPALVVMDVRLAGERDGIDAAIDISRKLGIRSMFVTAYSDASMRLRAATAEPADWLIKPVGNAQLVSAVRAALATVGEQRNETKKPSSLREPDTAPPTGERIRVLIVEDDLLHRMSLVALMRDRGLDTEEAASGRDALAIVKDRATLHVAIVDLGLPDMDGRVLVTAARRIQPGLRVVYATGYAASAVPEANADPLSRFLSKPFDERHLAVVFESFGWTLPPPLDPPPDED